MQIIASGFRVHGPPSIRGFYRMSGRLRGVSRSARGTPKGCRLELSRIEAKSPPSRELSLGKARQRKICSLSTTRTGKIVAFERAVDPSRLKSLNQDTNIAKMMASGEDA